MGAALAAAVLSAGHEAVVVSGPVAIEYPAAATVVSVVSTQEMLDACRRVFAGCDGLIAAAAPCDFRPIAVAEHKIKKSGGELVLRLEETPDILATLGASKRDDQWLVGFALETEDGRARAAEKIRRKRCNLIVLNGPAAMHGEQTAVEVLDRHGAVVAAFAGGKQQVAAQLIAMILAFPGVGQCSASFLA